MENNYTRIPNELLEALYQITLPIYELRIFLFILRKTYGFNKKSDWISQKQIAEMTGIHKCHVSRTLKSLLEKNMIIVIKVKNKKIIGIQENCKEWKLPIQITNFKKLPLQVTKVTSTGNSELPLQAHTKETITKETIQNKYIYNDNDLITSFYKENQLEEIFDYWNSKKIIEHRKLTDKTTGKINSKLKDYSIEEIKIAIDNYYLILSDDNYFFSYKWTLDQFLDRGFESFKDLQTAKTNYLKKEINNGNGNESVHKSNRYTGRDYTKEQLDDIERTWLSK